MENSLFKRKILKGTIVDGQMQWSRDKAELATLLHQVGQTRQGRGFFLGNWRTFVLFQIVKNLIFEFFKLEQDYSIQIKDLKARLDQAQVTNKQMQDYVNFLKNSYISYFNENTFQSFEQHGAHTLFENNNLFWHWR